MIDLQTVDNERAKKQQIKSNMKHALKNGN